jgi:acetate---CoA ligase (ADP-forming)
MKIVSPEILHKSDVGGVRVNIKNEEEALSAFNGVREAALRYAPDARIWGVSVQQMVKPGREVILGITYDPQFGHLLMFGLGGIYVEVLKDVAFRVLPVTPADVREMMEEIRAFALLRGVRGEPPADLGAVEDAMVRVCQLVTDFPEIMEMDVNPLMVYPSGQGAIALDSRLLLKSR